MIAFGYCGIDVAKETLSEKGLDYLDLLAMLLFDRSTLDISLDAIPLSVLTN